jgi:hypothetical protein
MAWLLVAVVATTAACDSPPTAPATPANPATPPLLEPTPPNGPASVVQSAWGPIWDDAPREFLLFAGAQPVELDEPVSLALDHPAQAASPEDIAQAYVTDLDVGGWRAVRTGPLEDGRVVVDATRDGTSCRAQVRATPLGGVVRITILYGAECPRP